MGDGVAKGSHPPLLSSSTSLASASSTISSTLMFSSFAFLLRASAILYGTTILSSTDTLHHLRIFLPTLLYPAFVYKSFDLAVYRGGATIVVCRSI